MSIIYSPAEDSYLMYREVKKRSRDKKVLDMGTGSGILAIAAKRGGAKSILAADINKDAVEFVKEKGIDAVESDLFSNIKGKFDLIVFNPPYLPQDLREDKESSLITSGGKKGDELTLEFLKNADKHLVTGGEILLLVSNLTSSRRIEAALRNKNMVKEVIASEKLFYEELFLWSIWKGKETFKTDKNEGLEWKK